MKQDADLSTIVSTDDYVGWAGGVGGWGLAMG